MKYVALCKVDNDIILRGEGCITTMQELYVALVDKTTTEIELRKDFIDANFTYSALCDFVEQSAAIAPNVRLWAAGEIYDNSLEAVREIKSFRTADEFVYAVEHNPTRIISTLQMLCEYYTNSREESSVANNKIATMLVTIDDLQKKCNELQAKNRSLTIVHNETEAKLNALVSRVNFKYEKTVEPDKMFSLSENKYSHILYIKELARVHYTDTLLYYVKQILNTMYSMPVRFVTIEPYYSYGCENRYPNLVPHWDLKYKDVQSSDILMAGFQPKLMTDILQNASHVNFLIILDRAGYMTPHVSNGNVSTVYTVSDLKDLPSNIKYKDVISYSPETMFIPYIENFNKLSPEERVTKYSSMDVTKHLINLLEEVK